MSDQTSAQAPSASRCPAVGPETGDPCIGVSGHDGGHPFAPEERPIHPASLAWLLDATKIPAEQVWSMVRKCTNEHEPDGNLCPGYIKFGPSDPQAACTTCGAWEGCVAPGWRDRIVESLAAIRLDMLDFPTAWEIQRRGVEHNPRCSSVPGWSPISGPALLCDCGAVETEWRRLVAEHEAPKETR